MEWELENFANSYRNWLEDLVDGHRHRILFDVLYDTEYVWWIERDEDRASDGVHLRERFEYESGLRCPEGWDDWPCSFLEFIIAMAFIMEESLLYTPNGCQVSTWFWTMMDNAGLSRFDDATMMSEAASASMEVEAIVTGILDREYGYDGSGGFFPLENPPVDTRNLTYWEQMNLYVMERGLV